MNQQQQRGNTTPDQVTNWPAIFCLCACLPLELVLHDIRTFGVRSIGPRSFLAVLLIFLFRCHGSPQSPAPIFWFMIAIILLCIVGQVIAKVRWARGERASTRYNGRPYAMWIVPLSEITIKRLEPAAAFLAGCVILQFNGRLGGFLITSAICLMIRVVFERLANQTRAWDINDAIADQSVAMQEIRGTLRR